MSSHPLGSYPRRQLPHHLHSSCLIFLSECPSVLSLYCEESPGSHYQACSVWLNSKVKLEGIKPFFSEWHFAMISNTLNWGSHAIWRFCKIKTPLHVPAYQTHLPQDLPKYVDVDRLGDCVKGQLVFPLIILVIFKFWSNLYKL